MADELDDSFLDGALDDFEQLTTPADTSFLRPRPTAAPPATVAALDPEPSTSAVATPPAALAQPKKAPAFDPLAKKSSKGTRKAAPAGTSRAGPAAASTSGDAGSSSQAGPAAAAAAVDSTGGPKLPPELENLAAELAKLIAETHPDVPDAPGPPSTSGLASSSSSSSRVPPAAPGMASTTVSLQALQEVRQQAVAAQGALPSPGGGGRGGMFGGLLPDMEGLQEPGMNTIVDSIMQHLLSKEVLQQPMQEIRDCYPPWLEKNRGQIPAADLERYTQQYGFIQQICTLYDQEPENYAQLVNLMQQMQACGDPPEDIVRDMSAGLEHQPPGEAADGMDDIPFDLQQLQQEINKCPVQ